MSPFTNLEMSPFWQNLLLGRCAMMKENIRMSIKEAERLGVMKQIDSNSITIREGSLQLGLSCRQMKRIRKRYKKEGEEGLISKKRGKPSNRKICNKIRNKVLKLLKAKYINFGPTLAMEKLNQLENIKLSDETIRKWMVAEGLWKGKSRKVGRVYQRRLRRSQFGELLQGDGSPHDWFEGRRERCTLLQFVDDATSKITAAKFVHVEATEGYLDLLKSHLEKYGRPLGLYVDKHSIFRVNQGEHKNGKRITHFGRVLKDLDIELICANSPQAKGRVERKNGVMQDRLVKEMRLQGINTIQEANVFLPKFIDELNQRFGVEAANPKSAHRPMREQEDLEKLFAKRHQRKLSKNLMFQHNNATYLIEAKTPNRLKHTTIEVLSKNGAVIDVLHKGEKLKYKKWNEIEYERPFILNAKEIEIGKPCINRKAARPALNHPWR
jgi:hypothetical protein